MISGDDQSNSKILKTTEALQMAMDNGLDLVEVSPNQDPPVCRLLDYGKFKYNLSKRDKKNRSKTTQTQSSKYTISLNKGLNKIKISTGIECQGLYEDNYLNSYEVKYAPNPIENYLDLYFGGNDDFIEIGVYTVNGQLIDIKNINLPFYSRNHRLETSNYKQGVYIIKMSGATIDQSIQVIKK